jgi:PAS domain S-box-containing protein
MRGDAGGDGSGEGGRDGEPRAGETLECAPEGAIRTYQQLIDDLPDVVARFDAEFRCTFINQAIHHFLGVPASELIGKTLQEFPLEPADREFFEVVRERLRATLRPVELEHESRRTTGSTVIVEQRAYPELGPDGEFRSALSVIRDVTAHRELERDYRALFNGMREAFVIVEPVDVAGMVLDFRYLAANPAFHRLTGVSPASVPGGTARETMPTLAPYFVSLTARVLASGQPQEIAAFSPVLKKNIEGVAFQIAPHRCAALLRDVTAHKRAEAALVQSREDSRRLATRLAVVEDRERRKLASFLHDNVGQALALVSLKLGSAVEKATDDDLRLLLEECRALVGATIEDTRGVTFDLSPPILYELGLEAALEWLGERLANEHGFAFSMQDDGLLKPLEADAAPFVYRAVRELILNAVKHADARHIAVSVARVSDALKICVTDDGVGFDPAQSSASSGFGLFSIREQMSSLGGGLSILRMKPSGTAAELTVPLASG